LLTTAANLNDAARVRLVPDETNGLKTVSFAMVDKVFSFDKADLAKCIGRLSDSDMLRVSDKLRAVLDL
jgi:mRNA-degrading endonuclease toxin of MazEF toxin-antitoxin module